MYTFEQVPLPPDEYMQRVNQFITETAAIGVKQVIYARFLDRVAPDENCTAAMDQVAAGFNANLDIISNALRSLKSRWRVPPNVLMDVTELSMQIAVDGITIDPNTGLYLARLADSHPEPLFTPITPDSPLYI